MKLEEFKSCVVVKVKAYLEWDRRAESGGVTKGSNLSR